MQGRKLAHFSRTVYISRSDDGGREYLEGLRVIFGEFSDIVENDMLTMQRFLSVSKFLYSGGFAGIHVKPNGQTSISSTFPFTYLPTPGVQKSGDV